MLPKSLLAVASLLLLGGAVTFSLLGGRADAAPSPRIASPEIVLPAAAPLQLEEAAGARTIATEPSADAPRAIPDDAEWIEIAVVDEATQAPVPGATVRWFDDSSCRHASDRHQLTRHEQWLLRDDCERLADLGGWRTSADARGHARVAIAGTTTVLAEHGARHGRLLVRAHAAAPAAGHRIELEPDRVLQVQVLDERGAPCSAVKVVIRDGDSRSRPSRIALTREPDGIATFRHLQHVDPQPNAPDEAAQWYTKVVILGYDDPGAPFSITSPPDEPLVLRLPPCGSVRARAEFAGHSALAFREIVFEHQRGYTLSNEPIVVGNDGYAHLRHVALGLDLDASAHWLGWAKFAGPRAAGQQVDVTVTASPEHTTWTGRLLERDRTPVADRPFCMMLFIDDGRPRRQYARTDVDGRFVVGQWRGRAGQRADRIWFEWPPTGEAKSRAELAPRTLLAGIEDLGDIVATTPPLVAGGRIRGLDARSLQRVTLRVEQLAPTDAEPERWCAVDELSIDKQSDGVFTIRGITAVARHRLAIAGDLQPVDPIEFAVGRDDLTIELDAGNDLAAGVLLPRGAPPELMVVELVPPPSMHIASLRRERLVAALAPQHRERHDVQWRAIPSGTYTLELRPWATTVPVLRIPDVLVPPPAGGDPRLADVDLRPLVRATIIDAVDTDGAPIHGAGGAVFPEPRPCAGAWRGYEIRSGKATIVVPTGPFDATVCCEGLRPQHLQGGTPDRVVVRVDPWPTVRVVFEGAPPRPDGIDFLVRAVPAAAVEGRFETPASSGELVRLLEPETCWRWCEDGIAKPHVGDGGSQLEVQVYGFDSRRGHVIPVHEPRVVLPTADHVTARIPPDAWRRAFDAVTAPPK